MKANIRQVEAFRAVMVTGSMTAAAETLSITQPAVSRLVRDFETSLKLTLFQRRGNQVTPTSEAFDLLTEVERSFAGLDHLSIFADNLRNARTGVLRVAAMPAMATYFLPRFVAEFCRSRPDIHVQIDGFPSHIVTERVANGLDDLGLCATAADRSSLEFSQLRGSAVVVVPDWHELSHREEITAVDLVDETIVLLGANSRLRHRIVAALEAIQYGVSMTTSLATAACVLAQCGGHVTIVDPFSASEFVGRGVKILPFVPSIDVGYGLVRSRQRPPSHLAKQFMTDFREYVARTTCPQQSGPVGT
jgi:DNA-binding transcriptional LysR family regulator